MSYNLPLISKKSTFVFVFEDLAYSKDTFEIISVLSNIVVTVSCVCYETMSLLVYDALYIL